MNTHGLICQLISEPDVLQVPFMEFHQVSWMGVTFANIEPIGSKFAIYEEFEEWIELDDEESIEILSSGKKIVDKPLED